MIALLESVSVWAIPVVLLVVPTVAYLRGVKVYEVFCSGAREGFDTAIHILPYLVAMFVAIGLFRSSNAFDALLRLFGAPASAIGIPRHLLPLALLRPLSGSGALGYLADILKEHGPDSLIGMAASTMQGSTETTFYVLTVYFGAAGVTKARHAVAVGLLADLAGFLTAVWISRVAFGG